MNTHPEIDPLCLAMRFRKSALTDKFFYDTNISSFAWEIALARPLSIERDFSSKVQNFDVIEKPIRQERFF